MPRRSAQRDSGGLRRRLVALAGLVIIVGGTVTALLAAGLLGNQGGGEGIESVLLLDPPSGSREGLDVGPAVGKLAPDFEVSAFDGTRHRLSDFRGKAVYVNFWATWCVPCQVELPDMHELQAQHSDELVVIAVNRREPLDRAEAYFRNLPRNDGGTGVSFAVNGIDPDDTLYEEYRALGMPASFFIDANGVVTRVFNGLIRLSQMEDAVTEALQSSRRPPDGSQRCAGGDECRSKNVDTMTVGFGIRSRPTGPHSWCSGPTGEGPVR